MHTIDTSQLPEPILPDRPDWVDLYRFAWTLAAKNVREHNGRHFMDCAWDPNRNYQWVWDTCFMALYCRYGAREYPGIESLDNFYELQRDDGYISMTYDLDSGEEPYPDRINPPLFAWVEWEHYRTTGDASRFERVVPHIEELMDWIDANRRTEPHRRRSVSGDATADTYSLYYFVDCGSSGMDNSPRTPRCREAGEHFDWIDLSSQMALSFAMLARIHGILGNGDRAAHWARRFEALGRLINEELWCERARIYLDRAIPLNFVPYRTAASFWPLLAGICSAERREALVDHLLDERTFNRPTPVPSLSADDPNYDPAGGYWLGGVWAPTNYMIARGLASVGRGDVAHGIAMRYLGALARTFAEAEPHSLWEAYSPEADRPSTLAHSDALVKPDFVGWTGVGPIAMLIENVIGLDIDVPARTVHWDIRLTEEHGVKDLRVGPDATADFLCAARPSSDVQASVTIRSDADLTVVLRRGDQSVTVPVARGRETEIIV